MTKDATLLITPPFPHNGTYANPVSVLHGENIEYTITAINATPVAKSIVITDTIPTYLRYVPGSAKGLLGTATIDSSRLNIDNSLKWTFSSVPSTESRIARFEATPVSGAVASQPLFINHAWVEFNGVPRVQTNGTYHQGAGISITTFSASYGGSIYNANEQALDYMTTPRSGIIIAPDEGYRFAGWRHSGYTSLRGVAIKAQDNIMYYDTLTVYGNIELHAVFEPVEVVLNDEPEEVEATTSELEDKVWTTKDELLIMTTKPGSIVRIYSTEGVLREQHTIVSAGTTSRKLSRGIYIVTINNNIGHTVRVE